jgi:hypothetical protein
MIFKEQFEKSYCYTIKGTKVRRIGSSLIKNSMEDKLKTLKNYETMVEAMFDQELLRERNIDNFINNEESVELMPMFGDINEGLRILVFEKDYELAKSILQEYTDSIVNT